jgi:HD-GYP domain-containing protein (c-di-GMP phosphodiesterase class II)
MIDEIINNTLSFLEERGISIFIESKNKVYGKKEKGVPIYSTYNKYYSLELYAEKLDIDKIFPIITFLDSVLSRDYEKVHLDFNNKMTEFFSLLSSFKDKYDSFEKISKAINKIMELEEVVILERIGNRLKGLSSSNSQYDYEIKEGSAEELAFQKEGGVYLNLYSKLKSFFSGENYIYIEPLKGTEKKIGLIIFISPYPLPIERINMLKQFTDLAGLFIEIHIFREDMAKLMENSLNVMIDALDSRTKGGKNHTKRVTAISIDFAKYIGLSEEEINTLKTGTLLHDIGKIGVSDSILNKEGPLTDEEMEKVRYHPVYGTEIIVKIDGLNPKAKDIVLYHHERWDGKGYPKGLKGKEIPFLARLVNIVDIYEALTSDRSYRKAYDKNFAIKYIKENKNKVFDPELADKFVEFIGGRDY